MTRSLVLTGWILSMGTFADVAGANDDFGVNIEFYRNAHEQAAENLRSYLLKGGFLIFDDFEHEQWLNFEAQMMRVVPDHRLVELDVSHPIFHSFFDMRTIDFPHPLVNVMPTYFGIFEDNDPKKRLMVIVNYNNDIAEYWEWSDQGWFPIEITNEAYKLGVNYMVYALTH